MSARTLEQIAAALQEPRLASHSGRLIRCSSLRPLDVLEIYTCNLETLKDWEKLAASGPRRERFVVLQNSAKLRKVEIVSTAAPFITSIADYADISAMHYDFTGRARKRRWLRFLPPFVRQLITPYSLP